MRSIRATLVNWAAGGTTIAVLGGGLGAYALSSAGLERQARESIRARAAAWAALVIDEAPDPADLDPGGLVLDYKGSLDADDLGVYVRVEADDGRVVGSSPDWPPELTPASPIPASGESSGVALARLTNGREVRLATWVGHARGESQADDEEPPASPRRIRVLAAGTDEVLASAKRSVMVAVMASTSAAGLAAWLLARAGVARGLRPLVGLASNLERADPGGGFEPPAGAPSELVPIVGSLTHFMSRARESMERERRFTDAAAHELRTPLAELRAVCDVARAFPEHERLERAVGHAGAIAREMSGLLDALLDATRAADPGTAAARLEEAGAIARADLAPILRDGLERWREAVRARGVALDAHADDGASWPVPEGAARLVLRNLIDNACEYTPAGGSIACRTIAGDGWAFEVRNTTHTLVPEQVPRMFEAFWRADGSRSDRTHRGLGLAIVAAQCEAWGLGCSARLEGSSTLVVRVGPPRPRGESVTPACAPRPSSRT